MTRRPRTVPGTAASGLGGPALVPTLLLADGDEAACLMVRDALLEGTGPCDLRTVASTEELADYLHRRGDHADAIGSPPPALVLIDHDLPGAPGALDSVRAIKSNAELRRLPVVVLARRLEPEQVSEVYDAGANTLLAKPVTFLALVKLIKVFTAYWLDAADLPEGAA